MRRTKPPPRRGRSTRRRSSRRSSRRRTRSPAKRDALFNSSARRRRRGGAARRLRGAAEEQRAMRAQLELERDEAVAAARDGLREARRARRTVRALSPEAAKTETVRARGWPASSERRSFGVRKGDRAPAEGARREHAQLWADRTRGANLKRTSRRAARRCWRRARRLGRRARRRRRRARTRRRRARDAAGGAARCAADGFEAPRRARARRPLPSLTPRSPQMRVFQGERNALNALLASEGAGARARTRRRRTPRGARRRARRRRGAQRGEARWRRSSTSGCSA